MSAEIKCEILKNLGVISQEKDITTELNVIKWSGSEPKFDLRRWKNREGERLPYKGITLDDAELAALKDILNSLEVQRN